jgi:hypothetical protein
MGNPVKVIVLTDTARPALRRMITDSGRGLWARIAGRYVKEARFHFSEKEKKPNKQGWPKSHFWSKIRNSTMVSSVDNTGATVTISDPRFAIHYYGGRINPKEKQWMTIPQVPQAKGIYPGSGLIEGLFFVRNRIRSDTAYLFKREPKGEKPSLYYVLKKSVTIPKDPTALPPDSKINAALIDEAEKYLLR